MKSSKAANQIMELMDELAYINELLLDVSGSGEETDEDLNPIEDELQSQTGTIQNILDQLRS